MDRAAEFRQRQQTAEITLPSGNKYRVKRPHTRRIAELGLLAMPGAEQEAAEPKAQEIGKPAVIEHQETEQVLNAGLRFADFMREHALDPVILLDGQEITDPEHQVHESDVAGDETDFFIGTVAAFFRGKQKPDASVHSDAGADAGRGGEAVSPPAA